MKTLTLAIVLAISASAFGQSKTKTAKSPNEFVPAGYVVFDEMRGDLNGDNKEDYVFVIKKTDKDKIIKHEYRGELDRNRRGLIIALSSQHGYELALENRECFSSENEDGGVYYAPELNFNITKGSLLIQYAHGRYGGWSYSFRYQNADFELIGYDGSSHRGAVIERTVSMNLLTRKMHTKENTNREAEGGDEKFKESWKTIALSKPIRLREIADFDDFHVHRYLDNNK
jgi:hypothetical protein